MHETRRNLVVGLFVLAGIIAFAVMIIMFGQRPEWMIRGDQYVIFARFPSAAGIKPGTVVTIAGIDVGRVQSLHFADRADFQAGVLAEMVLTRVNELPQGTMARTTAPGLGMGRPPVELMPGPPGAPALPAGAEVAGEIISPIDTLIPKDSVRTFEQTARRIGDAAEAIQPVLDDLHEILQPRSPESVDAGGTPGNLATAAQRLDNVLKNLNAVFGDADTQSRLKNTLANFEQVSVDGTAAASDFRAAAADARRIAADARPLAEKLNQSIDRITGNADQLAQSGMETLEGMDRVADNLVAVTGDIRAGEGTLGRLLTDPRMYEAMVLTFERMANVMEEARILLRQWQEGRIRVAF